MPDFGTAAYYKRQYEAARTRATAAEIALERCARLAAFWNASPGSPTGLPRNCMTNDCAGFWLDAAITGDEVLG